MLVLGAWRAVAIVRAVRFWGYAEREDELLVRHGLMFRRLFIVPYWRMQFVDVSAGPLERAFELATVELHTAAAATDARVPGCARRRRAGCATGSPPSVRTARGGCDRAGSRRPRRGPLR